MDLLSTCQVLLRDAGFRIRLSSIQGGSLVCFEDNDIIGFCSRFESPSQMINLWRGQEREILTRFSPSFRAASDKAWNVYCVFLSTKRANDTEIREVGWIEEDLERTRKIASCGISNRQDLLRCLLPVMPLQYQPSLVIEDATKRLKRRIRDIAPEAENIALDPEVSTAEVIRVLGGR